MFRDYVQHGWALCRIEPRTKGPRNTGWNLRERAITNPVQAEHLEGAGLCHAYSGTCALDIDRHDDAVKWLQAHGIDLIMLLNAPGAVQISSGTENRGKLIYRLPIPLPTKTFGDGAFELRCGTANGRTAQDVLPPSIHPSGRKYEWRGDWRNLPEIPHALLSLWKMELGPADGIAPDPLPKSSRVSAELRSLVFKKSPDVGYDEWIKIGMAIHHETGGTIDGLALWDEWSKEGLSYKGLADLQSHWPSFGRSNNPITISFLHQTEIAVASDFEDLEDAPPAAEDWLTPAGEKPEEIKQRFRFLELGELFERPKPTWIIKDVLPEAGVGAIYGQPGGGKTFLAVDLCLDVALGQMWRSAQAKQGPCHYIAAEDDSGVQIRLASGLAARGAVGAPVKVLPASPNLMNEKQAEALKGAVKDAGPAALIFFDTLAAVSPGSDENAGKDMSLLIHFCQKLHKLTGALVLLIHHEGKTTGKGMRGWSGLGGAMDVVWEVTDEDGKREMVVRKLKNAPTGNSYGFRLQPTGDSCVVEWL